MATASWILAALFAATALMGPLRTHAQTQSQTQSQNLLCDQRASIIGRLAEKFRESPIAIGVASTGGIIEVLTTERHLLPDRRGRRLARAAL